MLIVGVLFLVAAWQVILTVLNVLAAYPPKQAKPVLYKEGYQDMLAESAKRSTNVASGKQSAAAEHDLRVL
jgi:hypothetical protein